MFCNLQFRTFSHCAGAYAALMTAREDAKKIEALKAELETRKEDLYDLFQSANNDVGKRQDADEEFERLTKLLTERITDLQDEIRQLNRLVGSDSSVTGRQYDIIAKNQNHCH